MLTQDLQEKINSNAIKALELSGMDFTRKHLKKWGEYSFHICEAHFQRVNSILKIINDGDTKDLEEDQARQLLNILTQIVTWLHGIDTFDVSAAGDPRGRYKKLTDDIALSKIISNLFSITAPWISLIVITNKNYTSVKTRLELTLSSTKTELNELISSIDEKKDELEDIYLDSKDALIKKESALDTILDNARDKAGQLAVSEHENFYLEEANRLSANAGGWLAITLVIAVGAFFLALALVTGNQIDNWTPNVISRIGLVGMLTYSALWCGKNYRIVKHIETVNRHKSIGLRNFAIFSNSARSAAEKDTILHETVRSIYSTPETGYISSESSRTGPQQLIDIKASEITGLNN